MAPPARGVINRPLEQQRRRILSLRPVSSIELLPRQSSLEPALSLGTHRDQARVLEDLQVLRDRLLGDLEMRRDIVRIIRKFKPDKLVLYAPNVTYGPAWAHIFRFNLKRLGIDVEIKYFSPPTLFARLGTRGEPFDVGFNPAAIDYPDAATYFQPSLNGDGAQAVPHRQPRT